MARTRIIHIPNTTIKQRSGCKQDSVLMEVKQFILGMSSGRVGKQGSPLWIVTGGRRILEAVVDLRLWFARLLRFYILGTHLLLFIPAIMVSMAVVPKESSLGCTSGASRDSLGSVWDACFPGFPR